MIARFSHQTPKVISETPAPGTKAFSKLFIETSGKFEGLKKGLAVHLVDTLKVSTGVQGANEAQKMFAEHGFKLSSGYQTVRKAKGSVPARFTEMEYRIADACAAAETSVSRELKARTPATPVIDVAKDVADKLAGKTIDVPVIHLDEKGKPQTALGKIKGHSAKNQLAEVFASLQQAVIEEDLAKISDLILEGQKILAISK